MKIRKTICSLLLVCLAILGIFCGRANVYADQKQALSATVTLLKQEKDCVGAGGATTMGGGFSGEWGLVFSGTDNSSGCAFEQCLTLPQNGKKTVYNDHSVCRCQPDARKRNRGVYR